MKSKTASLHPLLIILAVAMVSVLFTVSCGGGATSTAAPQAGATQADEAAAAAEAAAAEAAAELAAAELAAQAGPKYGGSLTIAMIADHLSLDPALTVAALDSAITQQVYDNLLMIQPDLSLKPELATSWEANADNSSFTFHLRKGVKFHHGKDFTAEDVLYTFNRLMDPELDSSALTKLETVANIVAIDDYTVRFDLTGSNGFFLDTMADASMRITPADVDPARMTLEEFGTGPFMIDEHLPGERTVLARNPDYWEEGKPYLDEMVLVGISEVATRDEALKSGDVDVIYRLDPQSVPSIEAHPDTLVLSVSGGTNLGFDLDNTMPPFDNKLLRQAFQAATDRELIVQAATLGLGFPAYDHPVPPTDPHFASQYMPPDYDPELARSLLEQAGYPDGIDIKLHASNIGPGLIELAVAFKESAAPAGIRVDVQVHPADGFWGNVWGQVPMAVVYWPGRPNPDYLLTAAYNCEAKWNVSRYCNLGYDELISRARGETLEERIVTYAEAQRILIEEVPRLVVAYRPNLLGVRNNVRGISPHPIDFKLWQDGWLDD